MKDRKRGLSPHQNGLPLFLAAVALVVVLFFAVSRFLPDGRPEALKRELMKQGYDLEGIAFFYLTDGENKGEWIYRSSQPLDCRGDPVTLWSLTAYPFSSLRNLYAVRPYPPPAQPVEVTLRFSPEELESLLEGAEGQAMEEYLRELLLESLPEHGGKG